MRVIVYKLWYYISNYWLFVKVFLMPHFKCKSILGSLGLGIVYKKEDIIIGPVIDEAAQDYEQSNWIGISMTSSTSLMLNKLLNKNNILSEFLGDLYIQFDLLKKRY